MIVTLLKTESTTIFGSQGRVMYFTEEPPKNPIRPMSEEAEIMGTILQQVQIQIPMLQMKAPPQIRIILYLTEEEYEAFNENVNFTVNSTYEVKMDKGYLSIQKK